MSDGFGWLELWVALHLIQILPFTLDINWDVRILATLWFLRSPQFIISVSLVSFFVHSRDVESFEKLLFIHFFIEWFFLRVYKFHVTFSEFRLWHHGDVWRVISIFNTSYPIIVDCWLLRNFDQVLFVVVMFSKMHLKFLSTTDVLIPWIAPEHSRSDLLLWEIVLREGCLCLGQLLQRLSIDVQQLPETCLFLCTLGHVPVHEVRGGIVEFRVRRQVWVGASVLFLG